MIQLKWIKEQLKASADLKIQIAEKSSYKIKEAAELLIRVLKRGGKVFLCGNGGSAADCQHIAAEMVGRYKFDREGLSAIALTTDTSILTAVGNDYGFDKIFSRQVEALGKPGDVLVGLSTSGRSKNILEAMCKAKEMELKTIALVGREETPLAQFSNVLISVPSTDTPRIQEGHITIAHILCDLVEREVCVPE